MRSEGVESETLRESLLYYAPVMKFNADIHHRRSTRFAGYDYAQPGWYYVTICTDEREMLFGEVEKREMRLNEYGRIVRDSWLEIPKHYPFVTLDAFIVMPNHIHGIIVIRRNVDIHGVGVQNIEPLHTGGKEEIYHYQHTVSGSLGAIVRGFKIGVTKWFREHNVKHVVWQRNYYDHIIRNEPDYLCIREYILNNPISWEDDELFQPK